MKENCKNLKGNFPEYSLPKFKKYEAYIEKDKIIGHPINFDNIELVKIKTIDILLSLVNIYNKYNNVYRENTFEDGDSIEFEILRWCEKFSHPADLNNLEGKVSMYIDKKSNAYKNDILLEEIKKSTLFNVDGFKEGIEKLSVIFNSWYSIELAVKEKNIVPLKKVLIKELERKGKYLCIGINPDLSDKEILSEIKKDYWNSIGYLTIDFPEQKSKLTFNHETKKFDFMINPNTVLQIAWDTFGNLLKDTYNNKLYKHKIMICENCGDYIVRSSSTMKYCSKTECQAVRNRLKVKIYNKKNKKK